MLLESSYDKAFIDEELAALQDYFEIFGERASENDIYQESLETVRVICAHHQYLLDNSDIDSVVEMLVENFCSQFKAILPPKFDLGVRLTTGPDPNASGRLTLWFKLVAQAEINTFLKMLVKNPDSRISVYGGPGKPYWLIVIRQEKPNIYERKLLK